MKVINLTCNSKVYTSNVYFLLGNHNAIDDVNALIDVGRDPLIIDQIKQIDTGVGKKRVERVVITHEHFDHASLLPEIINEFGVEACAFHPVDKLIRPLKEGETLKLADREFDIIHTPGHSQDSVCLYCEQEKVLFSGDTSLIINTMGGTYQKPFVKALDKIARKNIAIIYPGHGDPIIDNVKKRIYVTLNNVRKSKIS